MLGGSCDGVVLLSVQWLRFCSRQLQGNSRGFGLAAGRHRLPSGIPDIMLPQGRCRQAYIVGLVLTFVPAGRGLPRAGRQLAGAPGRCVEARGLCVRAPDRCSGAPRLCAGPAGSLPAAKAPGRCADAPGLCVGAPRRCEHIHDVHPVAS
jgi:hypothetical protein